MIPHSSLPYVFWVDDGTGNWVHKPRWKLWINYVLMAVQFRTRKPWLIGSKFEVSETGKPIRFLGYCWARILLNKE